MNLSLSTRHPAGSISTGRFSQRFWHLFLIGLVGIATLPLIITPMIREGKIPEGLPEMPLPALVGLSLINPILLLAIGCAMGAWLAPKLGLISLMVNWRINGTFAWPHLRAVAPLAVGLGLIFALIALLIDALFQPLLSEEWLAAAAEAANSGGIGRFAAGLMYGGVTEEIMLRWGALSFAGWIVWWIAQRGKGTPSGTVLWIGIVVAALLFGVLHLPAVAAHAPLDGALVIRTIGLNSLGGLVFGWLFCRYHLEAAMLAHASTHVGIAVISWMGLG